MYIDEVRSEFVVHRTSLEKLRILHCFRWFCNHLFCLIFPVPYRFARFGAIHHLWMITSNLHEQTVLKIHHTYIYVYYLYSILYILLYHSIYIFIVYPLFLGNQTMPNLRPPSSWPTLPGEESLAKAVEHWHSALHPATGPSVWGGKYPWMDICWVVLNQP